MSTLLGVLIGVGRLSADSELIAMRACGISYRKIFVPVFLLGALGWLVCSVLVLWIEPKANYARHRIVTRLFLRSDFRKELRPRVFFEDLPGMLLYAEAVYRGGSSLEHILLFQTDSEGRDLFTTARRGHLDYDRSTGRIRLLMESGLTHRADPTDPLNYQVYGADRQMVLKDADEGFKLRMRLLREPQQKNYREQSLRELSETRKSAEKFEHVPTRIRIQNAVDVVFHERLALPLACIVFSLIGLPLGIYNRRGGRSSGLALSLAVVLVYWLLLSTGENLATEGKISPFLGLWTGNILFALAGTFLLLRRERRESGEGLGEWIGAAYAWGHRIRTAFREKREKRRERGRRGSLTVARPVGSARDGGRDRFVGGAAFTTLVDRYILRSFLKFLLMSCLSLYIIFLVVDFREMVDDVLNSRVPLRLVARFFEYRSPWIVNQILPVACLVSTLLAYGILSRFNEITAMKAGGLSLYRISVPVVASTFLLAVFSFYFQGYVVPFANQKADQIRDEIRGRPARSYSQPHKRWILGRDGLFYNYRNYTHPPPPFLPLTGQGVFQGFSVYRLDPATFAIQERIYAREATWRNGSWVLRDGWKRRFDPDSSIVAFERFEEKSFPLGEEPRHFLGEAKTPDQMSYGQLRDFIADLRQRGYSVQELSVSLYEKLALPFVSLVMVILGLPFAFRSGRRGSLYGIGLSILLVVVYYAAFAVMSALGQIGFLPPFLAAWAPNLLFTGAGAYMMLTLAKT